MNYSAVWVMMLNRMVEFARANCPIGRASRRYFSTAVGDELLRSLLTTRLQQPNPHVEVGQQYHG